MDRATRAGMISIATAVAIVLAAFYIANAATTGVTVTKPNPGLPPLEAKEAAFTR